MNTRMFLKAQSARTLCALSPVDQELSRLTASLERKGFRTRAADQPRVLRRGELATHYSFGSPHPKGYTEHPEWQALRQQLFRDRTKKCEHCGRTRIIQVHHRYYFSGCLAWDYDGGDLHLLCKICHSLVHGYVDHARQLLLAERSSRPRRYYSGEEGDDEEFGEYDESTPEHDHSELVAAMACFDEDNPELWRIEYIEDPEGRSDRLRLDGGEDSDDEEWNEADDDWPTCW